MEQIQSCIVPLGHYGLHLKGKGNAAPTWTRAPRRSKAKQLPHFGSKPKISITALKPRTLKHCIEVHRRVAFLENGSFIRKDQQS